MYKYRSKCRFNMLLFIEGNIVEILPSELFESKELIDSKYLEIVEKLEIQNSKE